ncbi:MAG: hypothetical protein ACR2LM_01290 [Pyrinomonadaceae bacterium]
MIRKAWMSVMITFVLTFGTFSAAAQESGPTPPTEEEKKEKTEKEKKAFALLEQVVDEAQLLRLPENRIRVQINAAELLWQSNEGRARSLFSQAADGVAEMLRNANTEIPIGERRGFNQTRTPGQLRQELVLTVARHDAPLAYQLLAATRQPASAADPSGNIALNSKDNLEQRLLAQVAALDPKLALQNAEQLLEKGQYPRSLATVLAQLQSRDKEGAAKLEDKLLKRLASANMLVSSDAGNLALNLLQPGPRPVNVSSSSQAQLAQSGYVDLMGTVIGAALRATPQSQNQPRQNRNRARGAGSLNSASNQTAANTQTPTEIEQSNARRLLTGLQTLLPQIDQNLPGRAQAIRQKISELGLNNSQRAGMNQMMSGLQQNTSEGMMAAAAAAPTGMQSRIYRRAALRAIEEGNVDRARQIANDHMEGSARASILQSVEIQQVTKKAEANSIEEARRMLSALPNDEQRIDLLLQLAASAQPANSALTLQLLNEARQLTNKRANSYQQFDQQLKVADAFREVEADRSFEILEPGIMHLNELLTAAATLSGFEVNVFREGELPLQGANGLSTMVSRYGQRLGSLATKDLERAQNLANRFQMAEPRIVARLAIVRGLLGLEPAVNVSERRFRQGNVTRRGQL